MANTLAPYGPAFAAFPESTRGTSTHPPFLGDVPAATAILDRFLAHATIVQMTGKRFRLRRRVGAADD